MSSSSRKLANQKKARHRLGLALVKVLENPQSVSVETLDEKKIEKIHTLVHQIYVLDKKIGDLPVSEPIKGE